MPSSTYRLLTTLRLPLLSLISGGMGLRGLVAGDARFDGGSPAAHMTRLAAIQAHKYFDSALGHAEPRRELAAKQSAPSSKNLPDAARACCYLAVQDLASHGSLTGTARKSELLAVAWGSADAARHHANCGIRQGKNLEITPGGLVGGSAVAGRMPSRLMGAWRERSAEAEGRDAGFWFTLLEPRAKSRAERRTLRSTHGRGATSVHEAGEAPRSAPECDHIGKRGGKVEVGQTGPLVPCAVRGMRQTRLVRTICGTGIGGGLTYPATPIRKGSLHACQP